MNIVTDHRWDITSEMLPIRLDKLVSELTSRSRTKIQGYINDGCVSIDEEICINNSHIINKPCVINVQLQDIVIPESKTLELKNIPLNIVYEDEHLLVVNKPAGMTTHPGNGTGDDTLVHALLYHCNGNLSSGNSSDEEHDDSAVMMRPGIVHRIDRDTSGLLVVAKNDLTHHALAEQIRNHYVERRYLAIIWGTPHKLKDTIDSYIARCPQDRTRMKIYNDNGGFDESSARFRKAITHYHTREIFCERRLSLVECVLETGRTHQIRAHMSHIGHSVLGDQKYGHNDRKITQYFSKHINNKISNNVENIRDFLQLWKQQALHAYQLSFVHPHTNQHMVFEAPIPENMQHILDMLRNW